MAELRPGAEDLVGPARLAEVAARFASVGSPLRILRDGLSPNSLCCLFETGTGRYLAKGTRPGRKAPGWVEREHQVMLAARAAGLPVPMPLAVADGPGRTLTEVDGIEWAVLEAARGEDRYKDASVFAPFGTDAEAHSAGTTLARFHLALGDFDLPPRPLCGPVAECRGLFAAGGPPVPAGFEAGRELFDALRRPLVGLDPDSLPGGVIHGDWMKRNLFFDGHEVSAILDFDLCNRGPWVFDLALALSALAYPWPLLQSGGEPHVAQGESFRTGYESVRPLSARERDLLPGLLPVCRYEYHLSLAVTALREGFPGQARWFWEGQVASLRWWYDRSVDA